MQYSIRPIIPPGPGSKQFSLHAPSPPLMGIPFPARRSSRAARLYFPSKRVLSRKGSAYLSIYIVEDPGASCHGPNGPFLRRILIFFSEKNQLEKDTTEAGVFAPASSYTLKADPNVPRQKTSRFQILQSSYFRPGTLESSLVLFVTTVYPKDLAWAAIMVSRSLIRMCFISRSP